MTSCLRSIWRAMWTMPGPEQRYCTYARSLFYTTDSGKVMLPLKQLPIRADRCDGRQRSRGNYFQRKRCRAEDDRVHRQVRSSLDRLAQTIFNYVMLLGLRTLWLRRREDLLMTVWDNLFANLTEKCILNYFENSYWSRGNEAETLRRFRTTPIEESGQALEEARKYSIIGKSFIHEKK